MSIMDLVRNDYILTVKEVAEYLGAPQRSVRWWASHGHLRAVRIGVKRWRFRLCDVEAFSLTLGFEQAPPATHPPEGQP